VSEVQVPNAVFDLAWSENTPGLVAAACGDGNIRVSKFFRIIQYSRL
jgi:predicted RNase H-like nuclease